MQRTEGGSALLAALIVIAVLAVVTLATFQLATIGKGQAARDSRTLVGASCAETARQYLLSRLRLFGLDPTTLTLDQTITVDSGSRRIFTGHARPSQLGADGLQHAVGSVAVIQSVQALPAQMVGSGAARNRDMTNMIVPGSTLGGRSYRAVVTCTDPMAGDVELEFTFKYGL